MMLSLEAILEERARRLAQRHELAEIAPDLPTHFIFRTGKLYLAMALDDLLGLSTVRVTPIPLASPWLLGVAAHRGLFWPVLKLDDGPTTQLLFLNKARYALQVTEPVALEWAGDISPPPACELPPVLRVTGMTAQGWLTVEVNTP
jgi:hypothetical protein